MICLTLSLNIRLLLPVEWEEVVCKLKLEIYKLHHYVLVDWQRNIYNLYDHPTRSVLRCQHIPGASVSAAFIHSRQCSQEGSTWSAVSNTPYQGIETLKRTPFVDDLWKWIFMVEIFLSENLISLWHLPGRACHQCQSDRRIPDPNYTASVFHEILWLIRHPPPSLVDNGLQSQLCANRVFVYLCTVDRQRFGGREGKWGQWKQTRQSVTRYWRRSKENQRYQCV